MTQSLPEVESWRTHLRSRPGVSDADVDELTDHLLGVMESLTAVGLSDEEAFLVAVRRVGQQDAVAREFAAEHTDRLWKHLTTTAPAEQPASGAARDVALMLAVALAAGLAVRVTVMTAMQQGGQGPWVFALGITAVAAIMGGWWAFLRRPPLVGVLASVGAVLALSALTQAFYPYPQTSDTSWLALLHVPILLGVVLGAVYLGRSWRDVDHWQDYVRYLGELLIYSTLIALGGGVLIGLAAALTSLVGVSPTFLADWVVPFGVGGALVVAGWLVEAKKSVVENMAPVLTAVFTPLFAVLLLGFLAALTTSPAALADREALIIVDLVLVVVWGLVLFTVSARPDTPPRLTDWLLLVLIVAALVVDAVLLATLAGRVSEFGASPNKLAALGENVVLLVSLAGSAWLLGGFVAGRRGWRSLERWQSRYLGVVALWAAIVVVVFPIAFGFR